MVLKIKSGEEGARGRVREKGRNGKDGVGVAFPGTGNARRVLEFLCKAMPRLGCTNTEAEVPNAPCHTLRLSDSRRTEERDTVLSVTSV
jgi:hypothetical protein